jgi:hypothetical protein
LERVTLRGAISLSLVLGAVAIVIAMVVVLPLALFLAGGLWSALVGQTLSAARETRSSDAAGDGG